MDVTFGLIFSILLVLLVFWVKYQKPSAIPGPRGLPYVGIAIKFMILSSKDLIPNFMSWIEQYGEIFSFEVFGKKYIVLTEPELLKPLLSSSTNINKGSAEYSFTKPMFNDGIAVSVGEKWSTRRKLLTPSFHYKILESSIKNVSRNAEEYVSYLLATKGKPTDIDDMTYLLTLKIICETAMGLELKTDDKNQNEFVTASKMSHGCIVHRFLRFWLFPDFIYRRSNAGKIFFKCIDVIHNFADEVIKKRKELFISEKNGLQNKEMKRKERSAFLDHLFDLVDTYPDLFPESAIREEVDTVIIAGHNPSATALKFLHFLLANYPNIQEKVYEEQMEIFRGDRRTPTVQDLQKMVYLEMVIKETLRLYPTVPVFSRLLEEDLQIDQNRTIPAGQTVVVFTYAVHRSKNHWDNPEEFIPERFAPGVERHPFAFIPFSAGPRNCIGQKYAMMELKTIMSTVVRQSWLEPVTTSVTLDYGITLHTVEPIIVKAFHRSDVKGNNFSKDS